MDFHFPLSSSITTWEAHFHWQFTVQCNSILKYHATIETRYLKGYFLSSLWSKMNSFERKRQESREPQLIFSEVHMCVLFYKHMAIRR